MSQVTPFGEELAPVHSKNGYTTLVNKEVQKYAQRYVDDYESKFGPIQNPDGLGGYNFRKIKGTDVWSNHAHGNALDIEPGKNPQGSKGIVDPDWAANEEKVTGGNWGGKWSGKTQPDPMHFEWPHGGTGLPDLPSEVSAYSNAQPVTGGASPAMITNYGRHAPDSGDPTAVASYAPSTPPAPASDASPGAFIKGASGALSLIGQTLTPDDTGARAASKALADGEAAMRGALHGGDDLGARWAAYLKSRQGQPGAFA